MPRFSPERLELARRRRGLTKRALAEAVGITPMTISNYAKLRRSPAPKTVQRFASVLGFPERFFYGSYLDLLDERDTSYRALSKATARQRMQAAGSGDLGILFTDWIDSSLIMPDLDIPQYEIADPELTAASVRAHWRLGEMSIENVVSLLETHGVRVFSLATDTPNLDAFSFWRGETPFVFLNTGKSAERTRMDAAHELGHLVLHKGIRTRDRELEQEAQRFAAAFLMPPASIVSDFPFGHIASLDEYIEVKRLWNVSVTGLIVRMRQLSFINDYRYRTLFTEASIRGFRRDEPNPCEADMSIVFDKLFNPSQEGAKKIGLAASDLQLYPENVYELMYGLTSFLFLALSEQARTTVGRGYGRRPSPERDRPY